MNPGKLKHRIELQQRVSDRNGYGESVQVWTTVARLWSEVLALRGFERTEAYLADARSSWRVTIRIRPDVTTVMRVLYEGRELEIKSVLPLEGGAYLELLCEATA